MICLLLGHPSGVLVHFYCFKEWCSKNVAILVDILVDRNRLLNIRMFYGSVEQSSKEKTLVSTSKALTRFSSPWAFTVK